MPDLLSNLYQQLGGVGLNSSGTTPAPYASPLSKPATPATAPAAGAPTTGFESYIAAANAAAAAAAKQNALLQAQINALPRLLPYDYTANNAKASAAAQASQNPLYIKMLNDYIGQAQVNQDRQTTDTATANKLLQENLQNTITGNTIQGNRTAEDVNNNIAGINTAAGNYQADTGQAFDASRLTAARSGNAGGGLTQQAADLATKGENTTEGRQMASFDVQKQAQDLFKTRTFEDISRNNALATTSEGQGESQNAVNLARYIQDYGTQKDANGNYTAYYTGQQQQDIESKRLQAVANETRNQNVLNFNNYIATLGKNARGQDIALTRAAFGL